MKYRKLGQTGFDVSVVSFGTWQLGGRRWHDLGSDEAERLLHQALDQGVNLFDSSTVYGQRIDENGYLQSQAQERLGKAFRKNRDEVYYCVKLGQFDEFSHRSDYSPRRMVEEVKQSLRRLQTDHIDILLVHAPTLEKVEDEKAYSVIATIRDLGLAKAIGYSFEAEPIHAQSALKQPIDVIMLQYNLLEQQCGDVLSQLDRSGIGVLVGGPFKRGYLSGKYRNLDDLPLQTEDYWNWNVTRNKLKVEATLDKVRGLLDLYGSASELRRQALSFILNRSGVSAAVIGFQGAAEIAEATNIVMQLTDPTSPSSDSNDLIGISREKGGA